MPGPDSVARFKFKRTLEQLAKKEGRGTELISLYVPPDRKIHEVLGQLREDKTGSNGQCNDSSSSKNHLRQDW